MLVYFVFSIRFFLHSPLATLCSRANIIIYVEGMTNSRMQRYKKEWK